MREMSTSAVNINWEEFNRYIKEENNTETYAEYRSAVSRELALYQIQVIDWYGSGKIRINSDEHFSWFVLRWS